MKRINIIASAFFLLSSVLTTVQSGAQVSAGVKGGVNIAGFAVALDTRPKAGLILGGFGTYKLDEKWSLQGEALFAMQGGKFEEKTYDFNYLNLPVTARYNAFEGLHLHAGFQPSILMSAKAREEGEKFDFRYNLKGGDISWLIGATYEWNNKFLVDVRLVRGISDISKYDSNIRNTGVQITVGYRLK